MSKKTLEEIEDLVNRWENGETWHVDEADECMLALCGIADPRVHDIFVRLNDIAGAAIVAKVRGFKSLAAYRHWLAKYNGETDIG